MNVAGRVLTVKKIFLVLYDTIMSILIALFSTIIVTNLSDTIVDAKYIIPNFALLVASALIIFLLFGLYNQMWLNASILQYLAVPMAVLTQTIFVVLVRRFLFTENINWIVVWFYFSIMVFALLAIRVFYRLFRNRRIGFFQRHKTEDDQVSKIRVLIIGAGRAGSRMAEDLSEIKGSRIPIGFIDDNPKTLKYTHMGIPVLGNRNDIQEVVNSYAIDEIIVAIPSLKPEETKDIVRICQKTKCKIRILPSVTTLDEDVGFQNVKDVEIEDLLGREPIKIETEKIEYIIKGKVILVTGGGGSIGSELCRQIAKYKPKQLIIFDIYENNAYDLQQELISKYHAELDLKVLIGSVRDIERVKYIFKTYKPQIVYHAAAHKHVPLMEDSPEEAIKNNVYGTLNVVKTSAEFSAERFVLISTDKAVNPTSVMGASKRLAEMTVLSISKIYPNLKCSIVRFGNVLGSNGSVIPLFKRQIEFEHRVTVTHRDMKRYFMTIPEAVSLVLQASYFAEGGEIFVLDMGDPVKILDLAEGLIRLSGFEPNVDIKIEFCGLRPGEKMFEELYFDLESLDKTKHDKIMKLKQIQDHGILSNEIDSLFSMFGHEYSDIKQGILKNL